MPRARSSAGFTLTELAVVLAIVGLLYTLSAQVEQRNREETQRRLEDARDLVLAFALANARLPCPAWSVGNSTNGEESFLSGSAATGGTCTDSYTGYVPARAIGFQPSDPSGFAIDAWGSPIRYAVSNVAGGMFTTQHTTASPWNLMTKPDDLVICSAWGGDTTGCGTATPVTNANVVAFVVWTQGKNYRTVGAGVPDEAANDKHRLPAAQNNHPVFVAHAVAPAGAPGGEFDDMLVWVPVGLLYSKMIAAGILP